MISCRNCGEEFTNLIEDSFCTERCQREYHEHSIDGIVESLALDFLKKGAPT